MATDVVAVYSAQSDAEAAMQALENGGFLRSDIQTEDYHGQADADENNADSLWVRLLDNLQRQDAQQDADDFSRGLTAGLVLVSVTTQTEYDAERAAHLLESHHTVDIAARAAQQGAGGSHADWRAEADDEATADTLTPAETMR